MNVPVLLGVFGVAVGATLAAQSWPLARAPGWEDLRWFSLAALTASVATACALGSSLPLAESLVPWAGRVQLLFQLSFIGVISSQPSFFFNHFSFR